MKILRAGPEQLDVAFTFAEVDALLASMHETMEALEGWDFSTRMGVEKSEIERLRGRLVEAKDQARSLCEAADKAGLDRS